jgi:cellulose synthase/poly-beta-1,6-N-acetylglucosamine synthase-like glycosyltransferase
MKTLIIIPTYNELENLPPLLKDIFSNAPETDILIVDDNSPDGTGELAEKMSVEDLVFMFCIAAESWAWEPPILLASSMRSLMGMMPPLRWTLISHMILVTCPLSSRKLSTLIW